MPALPDAPNVLRVDLIHQEAGDLGLSNRFFLLYSGTAPSDSDLNGYAAGVANEWNIEISPLTRSDAALVEVVVTDLTSPTSARGTWTGSHSGTRTGGNPPIDSCVLMNFSIARRYRGGKPRLYAPWGTETDLHDSQTWSTSFVNTCTAAWAAFMAALEDTFGSGTSVTTAVSVSYYEGVEPPVTLPSGRVKQANKPRTSTIIDDVVAAAANPRIGTQRRRVRA